MEKLESIEIKLEKLEAIEIKVDKLEAIEKKVDKLQSEQIYSKINPWEVMSLTQKDRTTNLRKQYSIVVPFKCIVTGETDPKKLKLAHILPHSAKKALICKMVGMVSQLDSFRNLMWLCIGLEEAFDQQASDIFYSRPQQHPFKNNNLGQKYL
jgi:hypothetical protein